MREVVETPKTATVGELVAKHGLDQKRFLGYLVSHRRLSSPSFAFNRVSADELKNPDALPVLVNWQLRKYVEKHGTVTT